MDSTILNRVGRKLEPDDKLKKGSKMLSEVFLSEDFKRRFREDLEKKLNIGRDRNIYYKRYRKTDISMAIGPLEDTLVLRPQEIESSSLIQEKIPSLEFQMKRMAIRSKNARRIDTSIMKQKKLLQENRENMQKNTGL